MRRWQSLVRWRLLITFAVLVAVVSVAWFTRAHWTPIVETAYSNLLPISIVLGIAFVLLGLFHAREMRLKGVTPPPRGFRVSLLGPSVDPALEAVGYAISFYASASMMGGLFFDTISDQVAILDKIAFVLALGGLMYWSLRQPTQQFVDTFIVKSGATVKASPGPATGGDAKPPSV